MKERWRLVGVAEIAEMFGVSKQRASVLCTRKGFPDPATDVLVLDQCSRDAVIAFVDALGGDTLASLTGEDVWAIFMDRGNKLPDQPRLWRRVQVQHWAAENGREVAGGE